MFYRYKWTIILNIENLPIQYTPHTVNIYKSNFVVEKWAFFEFFWLSGAKKFYLSTPEAMKNYDFLKVKGIFLLMHLKPHVLREKWSYNFFSESLPLFVTKTLKCNIWGLQLMKTSIKLKYVRVVRFAPFNFHTNQLFIYLKFVNPP